MVLVRVSPAVGGIIRGEVCVYVAANRDSISKLLEARKPNTYWSGYGTRRAG